MHNCSYIMYVNVASPDLFPDPAGSMCLKDHLVRRQDDDFSQDPCHHLQISMTWVVTAAAFIGYYLWKGGRMV